MNRRRHMLGFIAAVALTLNAGPVFAQASPVRVSWVSPTSAADGSLFLDELRRGLRELGHVEGRNLTLEAHWGENAAPRLEKIAADVVASAPQVIVAQGAAAVVMRKATTTLPVVFGYSGDPVEAGLVDSLARPGGNITGMMLGAGELTAKNFEAIRAVLPSAKQVALLVNASDPFSKTFLAQAQSGSQSVGVQLRIFMIGSEGELDAAFKEMSRAQVSAVMIQGSLPRVRTVELALKYRIPALSSTPGFADAGALFSYTSDATDQFGKVAGYVDRILKGAKPAELPIQFPTKFEFAINLKTAKAIRLVIPNAVLLRADRTIK